MAATISLSDRERKMEPEEGCSDPKGTETVAIGLEEVCDERRGDADLEVMSNGVLACSYGRPASCLMFSTDQGKIWSEHQVVSDQTGFNCTSLREVRPGRLLCVHDAPNLQAVHVDVERVE